MQHAFLLSRQLLARQSGTKQIIMITDGEPTAHFEQGMSAPFFSYPPVQETIDATLREVARCTREDIRINTFMLDATPYRSEARRVGTECVSTGRSRWSPDQSKKNQSIS